MYEFELEKAAKKTKSVPKVTQTNDNVAKTIETGDVYERINEIITEEGNFLICEPAAENIATEAGQHISMLPYEVFVYLLRWVISSELDIRSLEQISLVCRGFYLVTRDTDIWRLVCVRTWGARNVDSDILASYDNCWRHMYIERPRLNFSGSYISRTTYIRHGEQAFQDVNYRPCYIVEYYRYLRFFPGGQVLMVTTADDPFMTVAKLRLRNAEQLSNIGIMSGHYNLIDERFVSCEFKRTLIDDEPSFGGSRRVQRAKVAKAVTEQIFNAQFELCNSGKRKNHQLVWRHYSVEFKRSNGHQALSTFDLTPSRYPPFFFSRVKSYSTSSEAPLA